MKKNFRYRQFFLLIVDVFLMYISLIVSLAIRKGSFPSEAVLQIHLYHFSIIFVVWILIFYTVGFYKIDLEFDTIKYAKLLGTGLGIAGIFAVFYFYGPPGVLIAPKTVLFFLLAIYGVLLWGWRFLYGRMWRNRKSQNIGVGFIGFSEEALHIISKLRQSALLGYDIRFIFDDKMGSNSEIGLISVLSDYRKLRDTVTNNNVKLIVLPNKQALTHAVSRELYDLLNLKIRFVSLTDFYEAIFRLVPIRAISETWFLENIDLKSHINYEYIKDAFDRIFALIFLTFFLPVFPVIALIIKIESKGPVFFTQTRVGRYGIPFVMIKFRTMRVAGNDYAPTVEGDKRITKLGSFLRSSRIDELPQFINILRGEMSFIGPRPERPEIVQELANVIPYYQQRHLVKPGVTGWDQVSGEYHSPSVEDTQKKLQFDLYYLKNLSFSLDFSIIFKTILTMVQRKGR